MLTSFIPVKRMDPSTSTRLHSGVLGSPPSRTKLTFLPASSVSYSASDDSEMGDFFRCRSAQHLATGRVVKGGYLLG